MDEGSAGDGEIYVDLNGYMVMLDKRGTRYKCDIDGTRNTMKSSRPSNIDAESWTIIGPWKERQRKPQAKKDAANSAAPQPQTAPVEGTLLTLELEPEASSVRNQGVLHLHLLQPVTSKCFLDKARDKQI